MSFAIWAIIIGALLTTMALSGSLLKRIPLSTAMLYLAAGVGLGPAGWALMTPHPLLHSAILERMTEVAVLISLFAAGLKLGLPLSNKHWRMPVRLAFVSMTLTVALIVVIGVFGLGLSLGAAVLLGGILAPTDPVLASDVQVKNAGDRDRLRFSLTAEGGLNDGAAFPFVMLGLGLLGLHGLGTGGWHWLAIDVFWAIAGGLLIGGALGALIGKLVVYLRSRHKESVGLDEFLALGLIALAYGVAVLSHAYGFLAVFAAGLALQRVKEQDVGDGRAAVGPADLPSKQTQEERATDPEHASAYMMQAVRGFNEQLERIGEVAVVLVVGAMLAFTTVAASTAWFVLLLFVVVRPVSVWLGLLGAPISRDQRILISWFGIRGIGSIYYLMYAINHDLPRPLAEQIIAITLTTVTVSIVLHGISVTPLMDLYARRKARRSHR
ncbi:MAG: cation:proton antiporter [Pseudomonadota bacterium]